VNRKITSAVKRITECSQENKRTTMETPFIGLLAVLVLVVGFAAYFFRKKLKK
jgi:hypothetical protein